MARYGEGLAAHRASSRSPGTWASFLPSQASSKRWRRLCDASGALLVFDEVITGLSGRPRRCTGALRRQARPDRARQDRGRRASTGGVRRQSGRDGAARAGRGRLPGRHARGTRSPRRRGSRCCAAVREPAVYDELELRGARLEAGLSRFGRVQRVGSMLTLSARTEPVRDFDDAAASEHRRDASCFRGLLAAASHRTVEFERTSGSLAHGDEEIDKTIGAVGDVLGDCTRALRGARPRGATVRAALAETLLRPREQRRSAGLLDPLAASVFALGSRRSTTGTGPTTMRPRLLAPVDEDTGLLLGDYLYAQVSCASLRTGSTAAVGTIWPSRSRSAPRPVRTGRTGTPRCWAATCAVLGEDLLEDARAALRDLGDSSALERTARAAADAGRLDQALAHTAGTPPDAGRRSVGADV